MTNDTYEKLRELAIISQNFHLAIENLTRAERLKEESTDEQNQTRIRLLNAKIEHIDNLIKAYYENHVQAK